MEKHFIIAFCVDQTCDKRFGTVEENYSDLKLVCSIPKNGNGFPDNLRHFKRILTQSVSQLKLGVFLNWMDPSKLCSQEVIARILLVKWKNSNWCSKNCYSWNEPTCTKSLGSESDYLYKYERKFQNVEMISYIVILPLSIFNFLVIPFSSHSCDFQPPQLPCPLTHLPPVPWSTPSVYISLTLDVPFFGLATCSCPSCPFSLFVLVWISFVWTDCHLVFWFVCLINTSESAFGSSPCFFFRICPCDDGLWCPALAEIFM